MDSKGNIYIDPTPEEIKRKKLLEASEKEVGMNRKERREWYRKEKKRLAKEAKHVSRP